MALRRRERYVTIEALALPDRVVLVVLGVIWAAPGRYRDPARTVLPDGRPRCVPPRRDGHRGWTTGTRESGVMADDVRKGDHVTWNSHGSKAEGTVTRKITEDTEAGGRHVKASSDDPQYEVESEKSGKTAVHKPSALQEKK